jgi:pyruvate formate lyase activating enzyme
VRENREGEFYSLVYANPCAFHLDPIEKNPLFACLLALLDFADQPT